MNKRDLFSMEGKVDTLSQTIIIFIWLRHVLTCGGHFFVRCDKTVSLITSKSALRWSHNLKMMRPYIVMKFSQRNAKRWSIGQVSSCCKYSQNKIPYHPGHSEQIVSCNLGPS